MAEWKVGQTAFDRYGAEWTITELKPEGVLVMKNAAGQEWEGPVTVLTPVAGAVIPATGNVDGLQPDPPAAIARVASGSRATVLPSPVAPPSVKLFDPLFGDP